MSLSVKDCRWPWNQMLVLENGDVKPCCYAIFPIGNLNTQPSLKAHWKSDEMEEIRKSILANRVHKICAGAGCAYVKSAIPDYVMTSHRVHKEDIPDGLVSGDLRELAYLGHRDALLDVGAAFWKAGRGDDALLWFSRACDSGSPLAHFWMGYLLLDKLGESRRDVPAALLHLQKSSAGGYGPASTRLANYLVYELATPAARKRGFAAVKLGAEQGDIPAWFYLAQCYRWGLGVKASEKEYRRHLGIAARRGHAEARAELAALEKAAAETALESALFSPTIFDDDIPFSLFSADLRRNARTGDRDALFDVAHGFYEAGRIEEALLWFSRAADAGAPAAHFWLGYLNLDVLEEGRRNIDAGVLHLQLASAGGSGPATTRLGVHYVFGSSDPDDKARGFAILQLAAQQDDVTAYYYIAQCHRWGAGVAADRVEYRRCLALAARKGHEAAASELAGMESMAA